LAWLERRFQRRQFGRIERRMGFERRLWKLEYLGLGFEWR
jgi:hypothetical protein